MRRKCLRTAVFCLLITGLPIIPALLGRGTSAEPEADAPAYPQLREFISEADTEPETEASTEAPALVENTAPAAFLVLDITSGEVLEVPVREYVIGAVCAEMPASFAPEALKAQAVAAYTYARRQALVSDSLDDPSLCGADFSNDPARYQAYYTPAEIEVVFGDAYATYYAKIAGAVDAVLYEVLLYDEAPIIAAFHAMSGGTTESASHVWGADVPYLQPVDSSGDCEAPRFEETVTFTEDEVRAALGAVQLGEDPAAWFGTPVCSDSGTVLQLKVGQSIFTGQELREKFSLRSANFCVSYGEGFFTFTTRGYGHAVGMSQYGANAMALAGADYREILAHYYPGASLTKENAHRLHETSSP